MPTSINAIKRAVKDFATVQERHREFGAWDTEPDCQFQLLIRDTIEKGNAKLPNNAGQWELYTGMDGVDLAANDLTAAARKVVDAIATVTLGELVPLKEWMKEYCWRVC